MIKNIFYITGLIILVIAIIALKQCSNRLVSGTLPLQTGTANTSAMQKLVYHHGGGNTCCG